MAEVIPVVARTLPALLSFSVALVKTPVHEHFLHLERLQPLVQSLELTQTAARTCRRRKRDLVRFLHQ